MTIEFRHDEAPAISLTAPGASTPLPYAAHCESAAPITTGRPPAVSPAIAHGATTGGNTAEESPNPASRSSAHARSRRSKKTVELACVSSVASAPVSACSTTSRGCANTEARANTCGACVRIHSTFGPTWKASARCPVRACIASSPTRARISSASATARLSR